MFYPNPSDVTDHDVVINMDPLPCYLHVREYPSQEAARQAFNKVNGIEPRHPITASCFVVVSRDALVADGYGISLCGSGPEELLVVAGLLGGKQTFLPKEESLKLAQRHCELMQENGR